MNTTDTLDTLAALQDYHTRNLKRDDTALRDMTALMTELTHAYAEGRDPHIPMGSGIPVDAADADWYNDLGQLVSYRITESPGENSCEICKFIDGKTLPANLYVEGVTAPPFHPNCHGAVEALDGDGNLLFIIKTGDEKADQPDDNQGAFQPDDDTLRITLALLKLAREANEKTAVLLNSVQLALLSVRSLEEILLQSGLSMAKVFHDSAKTQYAKALEALRACEEGFALANIMQNRIIAWIVYRRELDRLQEAALFAASDAKLAAEKALNAAKSLVDRMTELRERANGLNKPDDTSIEDDWNEKTGKAFVTKDQLIAAGWNESDINDAMIADLNRVLEKYGINTPEKIKHFIAQCLHESQRGLYNFEQGSEAYFAGKSYGSKYRGIGYIQLTHEYGYKAFAIYLALDEYPELRELVTYKNPASNDANTIDKQYENLLKAAKTLGVDISRFTDIVDKGYKYAADNFSWESAGYFWAINNLNSAVDNGADVDDISRVVNRWDEASFGKREAFYDDMAGIFG